MVSILTTTPIQIGTRQGSGIAGVATLPTYQGRGCAGRLMEAALGAGGDDFSLLFAVRPELYQRHGFQIVDEVIQGPIRSGKYHDSGVIMPRAEVQRVYAQWAAESADRVVRNELRWRVWEWGLRACEPFDEGYVCYEGTVVREAILPIGLEAWPVPNRTEWIGLRHTTDLLRVPGEFKPTGLQLMARNLDFVPVMMMTDQF